MTLSASTLWVVMYVMILHWIGDFVLQSHWMASNKSHSWVALASHVSVYTAVLLSGITMWLRWQHEPPVPVEWLYWVLMNGGLHFLTDAVTSRWSAYLWRRWMVLTVMPADGWAEGPAHATHWASLRGTPHNFFVVIGLDQWLLHGPMLLLTALLFGL